MDELGHVLAITGGVMLGSGLSHLIVWLLVERGDKTYYYLPKGGNKMGMKMLKLKSKLRHPTVVTSGPPGPPGPQGMDGGLTQEAFERIGHLRDDVKDDTKRLGKDIVNVSRRTNTCLLYTSPSPRDRQKSRMPSSA